MNKKIIYIILAIIIVLTAGLILLGKGKGQLADTSITPTGGGGEKSEQTQSETDKIIREAIDTQNVSVCQQIQNGETRKWCIKNAIIAEASIKRDSAVCTELAVVEEKLECEDNVTITKALDAKNPALCQNLNDKSRVEGCKEYINPK